MTFTISRKLLLSYLGMALIMILANLYAVNRLQDLNQRADRIIHQDVTVMETAKQAMDTLLAMENAEKKYLILKDESIAEIFWARSRDLNAQLSSLGHSPSREAAATAFQMIPRKKEYEGLFQQEKNLVAEQREEEALRLSSQEGRKLMDAMTGTVRSLQRRAERNIDRGMNEINSRSVAASRLTILLTLVSLVTGLILAVAITLNISRPLKKMEKATDLIAEGHFDTRLDIRRNDEIGYLAGAFDLMAQRLKVLEALRLDASPLTRLPGNLAIEQEIDGRLRLDRPFSLCHVDLDNFKPFADAYGYGWGSEVIKETALLLEDAVKVEGGEGDFLGHIGGDDFVLIAEPERARRVCDWVVRRFPGRMERFYSEDDRLRGFIVGRDRRGQRQQFPLITITISIVTDSGGVYKNPLDMSKMAAEVKEYGKTLPGCNAVTREEMERQRVSV